MHTSTKDAVRAVSRLDEHALLARGEHVNINGTVWSLEDLRRSVARNLSEIYGRTGFTVRRGIEYETVRGMLIALGASSLTLDHAKPITRMIRDDFTL